MRSKRCALMSLLVAVVFIACAYPALGQSEPDKRITIHFKDVPVQSAIEMLFQGSGFNYAFEPGVQGTVNIKLVDVAFKDALAAVLKVTNMTMRLENGVYMIGPQKEAPPVEPPPSTPAISEQPTVGRKITEKIFINHAYVYDIVDMLQGQGTNYRSGNNYFGSGTGSSGFGSSGSGTSGFGSSGFGTSGFGSSGFGSSGFGTGGYGTGGYGGYGAGGQGGYGTGGTGGYGTGIYGGRRY